MAVKPPDTDGLRLFWWAAHHPPIDPKTSFSGKTILITGANVGLGFEAAVKFASLGAARLVLGVRSLRRGEEAKTEICRRANYDTENVHLYEIDMSTFASVGDFTKTLSAKEPQIDVAVLNAGVAVPAYNLSPEGYEMTLQVNVLSTALLAILLLPLLQKTSQSSGYSSHLVFVGSDGHRMVKPSTFSPNNKSKILDSVNSETFFNYETHYQVTKLLLMYVVDGLLKSTSARLSNGPSLDVIITTVCPGLCRTNLGRDFSSPIIRVINGVFQYFFARTAEEGSRTIVSGAALGKDAHGEFWTHDAFFR
jgi:NAD(P)-dependent dehydrogenase (short-subunit alcohol dehydrogenase family)